MSNLEHASRSVLLAQLMEIKRSFEHIKQSNEFRNDKGLTMDANELESVFARIQDKLGGSSKITSTTAGAGSVQVNNKLTTGPVGGSLNLNNKNPQASSSGENLSATRTVRRWLFLVLSVGN